MASTARAGLRWLPALCRKITEAARQGDVSARNLHQDTFLRNIIPLSSSSLERSTAFFKAPDENPQIESFKALLHFSSFPFKEQGKFLPSKLHIPSRQGVICYGRRGMATPNSGTGRRIVPLRMAGPKNPNLQKFGKDLTEAARNDRLDPVIGRDEIVRRCLQVVPLSRFTSLFLSHLVPFSGIFCNKDLQRVKHLVIFQHRR